MKTAIVTACSQDWLPMACATLLSCARNRTIAAENFIIMPEGSSEGSAQILRVASVLMGEPIRTIELDRQLVSSLKTGEYHETAVYRLALDQIIDHTFDRVLYLDSDLLVLQSLDSLLTCDLQGNFAAAVADFGVLPGFASSRAVKTRESVGLTLHQKYFNSGVLIFSWKEALASKVLPQARKLLAERDFDFPDQDALNIVFKGRWSEAHPKYNVQAHGRDIIEATIVHFTRKPKPWEEHCAARDLIYREKYTDIFRELCVDLQVRDSEVASQGLVSRAWHSAKPVFERLRLVLRPSRRKRKKERAERLEREDKDLRFRVEEYAKSHLGNTVSEV